MNEGKKDIFKTWADSYAAVSKMWEDSYLKLYKPWIESTGEMLEKTSLLSKEATPQKYREFYDEWINTYQNTFGKFYPIPTLKSNKETLDKFLSSAEESNKLYRSWIAELEENSRKTKEIFGNYMGIPDIYLGSFLQMSKLWKKSFAQLWGPLNESMLKLTEKMAEISRGGSGPEAYKEFYNLWVKMYEKAFDSFFEDMPTVGGLIEIMEPVKIMNKMYADTFANMSRMWVKSGVHSASAYPGKNIK